MATKKIQVKIERFLSMFNIAYMTSAIDNHFIINNGRRIAQYLMDTNGDWWWDANDPLCIHLDKDVTVVVSKEDITDV